MSNDITPETSIKRIEELKAMFERFEEKKNELLSSNLKEFLDTLKASKEACVNAEGKYERKKS